MALRATPDDENLRRIPPASEPGETGQMSVAEAFLPHRRISNLQVIFETRIKEPKVRNPAE